MADDPRLSGITRNANERIQDRIIRHAVFLERYKTTRANEIIRTLNKDIIPGIVREIERRVNVITERGSDPGPATTRRLNNLKKALSKLTKRMARDLRKEISVDLDQLTRDELRWTVGMIQEELEVDIDFELPSIRTVEAAVSSTPFVGRQLEEWFDTLGQATQRQLVQTIQQGLVEGATTPQIVRRVRGSRALNYTDGILNLTRRQTEAVVRTSINHTANQARLELFKQNSDIVKGLQWTATLDSRTSEICAGLDGKVFGIDEGPRPPAHVNCRSTMTPVIKNARQLGLKDIPEGTRASINGQVPGNTTYGAWLKRQPVAVQEQVLGKTKAKLFREGNLPIERFTNQNLKTLSLDELRRTEKSAFKRAGIDIE